MMSKQHRRIWIWQQMISPHMAGLAAALACQGNEVVYVAEHRMSDERARQGWSPPDLGLARLELAPTKADVLALVKAAPPDSIHICQGIRANGLVGIAQRALAERCLRQWIVMETVEDSGWLGILKRLEYRRLFWQQGGRIQGLLATGDRTPDWVIGCGLEAERVFPFAYFLPSQAASIVCRAEKARRFRFIFIGQLIDRKRLDLLISALATLKRTDVELAVIGSGPLEGKLKVGAEAALPGRVIWIGRLPMNEVPHQVARADCLVLPSRHDGWGVVLSEALMLGTPAICSDACGAAGVVKASGVGGVFPSGNCEALSRLVHKAIVGGGQTPEGRLALARWARCLGTEAGAAYLRNILEHVEIGTARPLPPWKATESKKYD